MHGDHRHACGDGLHPVGDRDDIGGVGESVHHGFIVLRMILDGKPVPTYSGIMRSRRDATLKPVADQLLGQFAADEDEAAFALLAGFPFALMIAFEHHVNALKHETLVVVLERQDALAAQDRGALFLDQSLQPGQELLRVERLLALDRNRLHVLVVIVLQPAMTVPMVMTVMMMVMIVVVVMIVGFEEGRLDLKNTIQIECLALQHIGERDLATLGAVQPRVRVDAADARLDFGEFGGASRDRSC